MSVPIPAGPWCWRCPSLSPLLLPPGFVVVRPPLLSVVRAGVVPVVPMMMAAGWVRIVFLSRVSLLLVGVLVPSRSLGAVCAGLASGMGEGVVM